jgi:CheY-like chemotaxis protein
MQRHSLVRIMILIVEDDPANRRLMETFLHSRGYNVASVANAEAALTFIRDHRPRLVLLDIRMPGINGIELAHIIRSDSTIADIPLIAVTAQLLPAGEQKMRAAGFDGFLPKPIKFPQLEGYLRQYVQDGSED